MATRAGKYKLTKRDSAISLIDGGSATGEVNLQKVKVGAAHADGATLTVAESGMIFIESTNGATVTLPPTQKGLMYTFVWGGTATHTFNISPNASDKIQGSIIDSNAIATIVEGASNGAGADNKDLQLDSGSGVGDRVTLLGNGTNGWIIVEGIGSWVFES